MKLTQSTRVGAWFLIGSNLLMALGSVWVFMRMAPAIDVIIYRNERSLQACEAMLSSLAMINDSEIDNSRLKSDFLQALKRAQNNITEKDEALALEPISQDYLKAFDGILEAKADTVTAILRLGQVNRDAMVEADKRARHFGSAGAWGVVFMALIVFLSGMLFVRALAASLARPLEEIEAVVKSYRGGDTMRRCTGAGVTKDMKALFNNVNAILDALSAEAFGQAEATPRMPPDPPRASAEAQHAMPIQHAKV